MSAAEKEENVPQPVPQQDSRWWEGYIIRYAVGTVVGGMCVYFILHTLGADAKALWLMQPDITQLHLDALIDICKNTNSEACLVQAQLAQDLYGFNFPQLALLGAYGLAFNYIASAPVLVFHAVRQIFFSPASAIINNNFDCLLVRAFLPGFLFVPIILYNMFFYRSYWLFSFLFFLCCFYLVLQFIFICKEYTASNKIISFYSELHKARQSNLIDTNSYKHLREHGNAFMLVIHNVLLLCFVFTIVKLFGEKYILLSLVWALPAACVYFVGHKIESEMVKASLKK